MNILANILPALTAAIYPVALMIAVITTVGVTLGVDGTRIIAWLFAGSVITILISTGMSM